MGANPDPDPNDQQLQDQIDDLNAYQPWPPPTPQATLGVNAEIVYGAAAQAVAGSNTQVFLGSTSQITMNPATLLGQKFELPPALKAFASGGAGGSLAFTLGSTASINLGPKFEVNWGSEHTFNIGDDGDDDDGAPALKGNLAAQSKQWATDTLIKKTNKVFAALLTATALAWFIAYGTIDDEDKRAQLLVILQGTLSVLITVMLGVDMLFKQAHVTDTDGLKKLFQNAHPKKTYTKSMASKIGGGVASLLPNLLVAAVSPAIIEGCEEGHFLTDIWSQATDGVSQAAVDTGDGVTQAADAFATEYKKAHSSNN